jgi:hypothetical protein
MNKQFNISSIHARGIPLPSPGGIIQSSQNNIPSVVQSIASAATSISASTLIEIPKSCSLGTRSFCVSYVDGNNTCHQLPFMIPNLPPTALLGGQTEDLQELTDLLSDITPGRIQTMLIVGVVSTFALSVGYSLLYMFWRDRHREVGLAWLIFGLPFSILCFLSFLIPTIKLYYLLSSIQRLPAMFHIKSLG